MSTPLGKAWVDRVAHDLRGPLAPMQTAVYLLREPAISDSQRDELLAVLDRQIERLSGMIGEFSDFGRAETGRLVAHRETVDIAALLADLGGGAQDCPPQVALDPAAHGLQVQGDVLRLAQLFQLLLGMQLTRGQSTPVSARIEAAGGGLRMTCALRCAGASDELAQLLLAAPHPDPPDDTLGFRLLIAGAIADAHGGSLEGSARDPETLDLVLELPAAGSSPGPAATSR
ncbi:sensor histidine kinase [Luteimonas sp. SDU82]|uniref:sensor histidine kinase n=1 Tax=Luteimonas sp. SDU82 TaxID=3422592 RepID=UPI003EC10C8D